MKLESVFPALRGKQQKEENFNEILLVLFGSVKRPRSSFFLFTDGLLNLAQGEVSPIVPHTNFSSSQKKLFSAISCFVVFLYDV